MKVTAKQKAFSLVEIIAAVAIVALLLGLLVPALSMVHQTAMKVKQKAQLNSISIALEAFKNDSRLGDYPPSYHTDRNSLAYTGAQKLAEALIGRDGFGFNPYSDWTPTDYLDADTSDPDKKIYGLDTYGEVINFDARKGPYLELETANAGKVENVYNLVGGYSAGGMDPESYVITDVYGLLEQPAGKYGMPVLYYKADTSKSKHYPDTPYTDSSSYDNVIYSLYDNTNVLMAGVPLDNPPAGNEHPIVLYNDDVPLDFYDMIKNPNFTSPPRPYKNDSFILQCAGPDALYGTQDDIFNFDKPED